jgi:iron-sulfur cluster repair protein YtfE (RIC family)
MTNITEPLRAEHRDLLPHIQQLRTVADCVGEIRDLAVETLLDEVLAFLNGHLLPHARAEEAVLYPAVAVAMGAPEATRTMSRDHREVLALVDELTALRARLGTDAITPQMAKDLRRVLYGLFAVVKLHFAKEEEVYLPLLDATLTPAAADALFAAMGNMAREGTAA